MASFGQLTKSKEFQELAPDEKLDAVRKHWDAVEASATDDETIAEAREARELTLGGISAWRRANNTDGSQTPEDQASALEEAKRYDAAWALFGSGKALSDPDAAERYQSIRGEIGEIGKRRQQALLEQARAADEVTLIRMGNLKRLADEFLSANNYAIGAKEALDTKSGVNGIIVDGDEVETPYIKAFGVYGDDSVMERLAPSSERILAAVDQAVGRRISSKGGPTESTLGEVPNQFAVDLKEYQKESGMSWEDIKTAWSDFGNLNRKWGEGERIRVLSDGNIELNRSGAAVLDEAALRQEILAAPTTDAQKRIAISQIRGAQMEAANSLVYPLDVWGSQPWRENFTKTAERELAKGHELPEITADYIKRNRLGGLVSPIIDKLGVEGGLKLAGTVTGAAGAVTGADPLTEAAAALSEKSGAYSQGESALVGPRGTGGKIWSGVLAESPSLAAMIMLTKGAGAGGFAAGRSVATPLAVAGRIGADAAVDLAASTARAAALITSIGTAGVQSMGMTYSEEASRRLAEGYTLDEAHEYAQPKAYRAGLSTAIIAGSFAAIGHGGLESAVANMTARQYAARAAAAGITAGQAAKTGFRKMFSKLGQISSSRAGSFVKGYAAEFSDESLDQFVQKFLTTDPDTPIVNAFEEAWDAGLIGGWIGGPVSAFTHQAEATDPKVRNEKQRAALRSIGKVAEDSSVHEVWTNDAGERVGLVIGSDGLMTRVTEQEDGTWAPEGQPGLRHQFHNQLVRNGFYQSSAVTFDEEGNPSGSVDLDPENSKRVAAETAKFLDERTAERKKLRERQIQEGLSGIMARRGDQLQAAREAIPEERKQGAIALLNDQLARVRRMQEGAAENEAEDAATRPEAERQAGLFDYVAVAGADEKITAEDADPDEVKAAVEILASKGITTKNELAINLNTPFVRGDAASYEQIATAAQILIGSDKVGGFGVLPEGFERNEQGELVSVAAPEIPSGARSPEERRAHAVAVQTITERIAKLDKALTLPEGKKEPRKGSKAAEERIAQRAERAAAQAELDTLQQTRRAELAAAQGRPVDAAPPQEAAADEAPAATPPAEAAAEVPPAPAEVKAKRAKAKAATTAAAAATAEAEGPAATAEQAAAEAARLKAEAEEATRKEEKERLDKAAADALEAAEAALKGLKEKKAAAEKAKADASPAPTTTPPVATDEQKAFVSAIGKFIEKLYDAKTNLARVARVKELAKQALKKGFITKAGYDEAMREAGDKGMDPDDRAEAALNTLILSANAKLDEASAPVATPTPQATPQAETAATPVDENPAPETGPPAVQAAEETSTEAPAVAGVEPTAGQAPAPTPAPAGGTTARFEPGTRQHLIATQIRGDVVDGIADDMFNQIGKPAATPSKLVNGLIDELVEDGVLTEAEASPIRKAGWESQQAQLLAKLNDVLGIKPDPTPAIQRPKARPTAEDTNSRTIIRKDANPAVNDSTKAAETFQTVQNKDPEPKPSTKMAAAGKAAETLPEQAIAAEVSNEVAEEEDPNDPSNHVDPDPSWGEEEQSDPEDRSGEGPLVYDENGVPITHETRHRTPVEKIGGLAASPTIPAKALHKLLRQIERRFGLKVVWKNLKSGVAGQFKLNSGQVWLNKRLTIGSETPLHELGHAFLAAVRAKNHDLYMALLHELDARIDSDPELQRIRSEVIDTYNESNENTLMEEVMVAYLGKNADAIMTRQYWKDQSTWESKNILNKMWSLIRDALGSIFPGNRQSVAGINQTSTLDDIASLLADPRTRLDLTRGEARGSTTPQAILLEHAIGVKAAAQAVLDSLHDTSKGVMALTRDAAGKIQVSLTISDGWTKLSESVKGMIDPIRGAIGNDARQAEFYQRWKDHKDYALDEKFWQGFENARGVISNITGRTELNHEHVGYVLDLLGSKMSNALKSGKPTFEVMHKMLQLRDSLMTTSPTFVSAAIARIPGSAVSPMMAAFAELGQIGVQLETEGKMVPLSEAAISTIRDMMQERVRLADFMANMAKDPNLDQATANHALRTMFANEHAAAVGISEATGVNPLASRNYTVEDYIKRRLDPTDATWAGRQMKGKIKPKKAGSKPRTGPPAGNAPPTTKAFKAKVDATLTEAEKAEAAKELGFKRWGPRAREAFKTRWADWKVTAREKSKKLADLFRKVMLALGVIGSSVSVISTVDTPAENIRTIPLQQIVVDYAASAPTTEGTVGDITEDDGTTPLPKEPTTEGTIGDIEIEQPESAGKKASSETRKADFGGKKVTGDIRRVANYIVGFNHNKGLPFVITDKNAGKSAFFTGEGVLIDQTNSLHGKTPRDVFTEEEINRTIEESRIDQSGNITPTGVFDAKFDQDAKYGPTIIFLRKKNSVLAYHEIFLGREATEHRQDAMDSETGEDNGKSLGCINISSKMARKVLPAYKEGGGFVYILPQTAQGESVFLEAIGADEDSNLLDDDADEGDFARRRGSGPVAPSTSPVTPPKRFGDGTKDGLFNAISGTKPFAFEGHKIMPKADGTPSGPFDELTHAKSFRATAAAKEGLKTEELTIWKAETGGKIVYLVLVPNPLGHGFQQRVGHLWNPTTLEAAMSDALVLTQLPSMEEFREMLVSNKLAARKIWRWLQKKNLERHPEDEDKMQELDFLRQLDSFDEIVMLNKYQQLRARSQAVVITNVLRARHRGAFLIDNRNPNSLDYGKVENVALKPGQSPYLSDILQKAMVDPNAYNLSPAQIDMVNDIRSVLEQMRSLMRDAKLDKKFLDSHGLDSGDFLNDPVKGKDTWREYFPRKVMGTMSRGGRFTPKLYIGGGSTKSEVKGMDKARIIDEETGIPRTMQQVRESEDTRHIVYDVDPFETLHHFFTNSYSAIAAADLAEHLTPHAKPGQDATLRTTHIREIAVMSDVFDNEVAQYLKKRLVDDQTLDRSAAVADTIGRKVKNLALGGFDIAALLTTGFVFAAAHPLLSLARGQGFQGFADVVNVTSKALTQNLIPGIVSALTGRARDMVNDPSEFDDLWVGSEDVFSELAMFDDMLSASMDYQEQQALIARNTELASTRNGKLSLKGRFTAWMQGFGDFHRNLSTFGKAMMWKGQRERYRDPATGGLATDRDSVRRMLSDVRSLGRVFGYSADLQLSNVSANQMGWMRAILIAPTMYVSMANALNSPSGAKLVGSTLLSGAMYYVAVCLVAGMKEDDIFARMVPGSKDFMVADIKLPGGAPARLSLSNFYASLIATAGKTADTARKHINGEPVLAGDYFTPWESFARNRVSPLANGVYSFFSNTDFLGNEISKTQAVVSAFTPVAIDEPVRAWAERITNGRLNLATAEEEYTWTEKQSLAQSATIIAGQVLGANIYGERESQRIARDRDSLAMERFGKKFDSLKGDNLGDASKIADEVAKKRGSPERFGQYDYLAAKKKDTKRFVETRLSPEIRRMLDQSGALETGELKVTKMIKTKGKQNIVLSGGMLDSLWRAQGAAVEEVLRPILMEDVRGGGGGEPVHPAKIRTKIVDAFNSVMGAEDPTIRSRAGFPPSR